VIGHTTNCNSKKLSTKAKGEAIYLAEWHHAAGEQQRRQQQQM
jgi:hypothetical protein